MNPLHEYSKEIMEWIESSNADEEVNVEDLKL